MKRQKLCRILTFFSLLLLVAGATRSQGQAKLIPRPAPAPEYALGPGDQLVLHVVDMEEISEKPIRIDPNGYVDLPLVGRIQAAGLTLEQFKEQLTVKLSKYINSPQISLNLTDDQSRPVSVIGEVNSPGLHQLLGPRRLIEVISLAGGVKSDAGPKVIVTRQMKWGALPLTDAKTDITSGYSTASLSLDDLLASKDPTDNILVQPNDIVSIPKADVVYVVGNVRKAGGFALLNRGTVSILQAVSLAEGLSPDAAGGKARIIRPAPGGDGKPHEIPVNVSKVFAGKDPDVPLYANDVLYIPNSAVKSSMRRGAEAVLQVTTGMLIYRH
jgi:polysaccharide export outer membrane protein